MEKFFGRVQIFGDELTRARGRIGQIGRIFRSTPRARVAAAHADRILKGDKPADLGRDEEVIREYIRAQEKEDSRLEQMNLWR